VNKPLTLLIADRNPHVREFLKREMMAEGYHIQLVKSGRELIEQIQNAKALPDMLILDPDLPDVNDQSLVHQIQQLVPQLPIVIHTLQTEMIDHLKDIEFLILIEKKGSSVDHLKLAVKEIADREG
jgi:CheY-like chemotaxis protein